MHHVKWISRQEGTNCSLPNEEIHVWKIARAEFSADCLTNGELARAQRFKNEDARMMYARARAALRYLMSGYCGKEAGEFVFESGEHGKPFCADAGIHFNTTHSGDLLLIAFGREELGIDVECGARVRSPRELARRYYSAAENRHLESLGTEEAAREAFLRFWVCKEAALKASGHGLAGGLERTQVEPGGEIHRGVDGKKLRALEFMPGEGFHGALVGEVGISHESVKWFVLS